MLLSSYSSRGEVLRLQNRTFTCCQERLACTQLYYIHGFIYMRIDMVTSTILNEMDHTNRFQEIVKN